MRVRVPPWVPRNMYKVKYKDKIVDCVTLDLAMTHAKTVNEFVTIQGDGFEVVGIFGVDTVADGKCPDGVAYDWNKASRIGRMKRAS